MIRAGGVSECRSDATIFLSDEIIVRQPFVLAKAPLLPDSLMQILSELFSQPVSDCLGHDRVVVIVSRLEFSHQFIAAVTGRDSECAQIVSAS